MNISAYVRSGWLVVNVEGADDLSKPEILMDGEWQGLFRDWDGGVRVFKIRPPLPMPKTIRVRFDGGPARAVGITQSAVINRKSRRS